MAMSKDSIYGNLVRIENGDLAVLEKVTDDFVNAAKNGDAEPATNGTSASQENGASA